MPLPLIHTRDLVKVYRIGSDRDRAEGRGSEIHALAGVSVDIAPGDWAARFDRLLDAAASLTVTSDHRATGSVAPFEYANLVLTGTGQLRAQLLDTELRGLAVWDRTGGGARGGSASVVSLWQARGIHILLKSNSGLASAIRRRSWQTFRYNS